MNAEQGILVERMKRGEKYPGFQISILHHGLFPIALSSALAAASSGW